MQEDAGNPTFFSTIVFALGCLYLIRGCIHAILLDFAATNIVRQDPSSSLAGDLLQMMGAPAIYNHLTGTMLILTGWKARPLAPAMVRPSLRTAW